MYLILGNSLDPCCQLTEAALRHRGCECVVIDRPFSDMGTFAWHLAGEGMAGGGTSRIATVGRTAWRSDELKGVLVRETRWVATEGWAERDAQYMAEEVQSALLGWLWSLPCRVIGRMPAWLFFRPQPGFLAWVPMLQRAGLRTQATVVSSDAGRLRNWRGLHDNGAVLSPLTGGPGFQVTTEAEWTSVLNIARHAPVALKEPHGATRLACVVERRVLWDGEPPCEAADIEQGMVRFGEAAGLDCFQLALAPVRNQSLGLVVVGVEAQVQLPLFGEDVQRAIADAIADRMTEDRSILLRHPSGPRGEFLVSDFEGVSL